MSNYVNAILRKVFFFPLNVRSCNAKPNKLGKRLLIFCLNWLCLHFCLSKIALSVVLKVVSNHFIAIALSIPRTVINEY